MDKQIYFRNNALMSFIMLSIVAGNALAADGKVYPGEMGVKWSGPAPTYNTGAIVNSHATDWMYVDLPIVNDDLSYGITSSWVKTIDQHYSKDIRCSVNSAYWNDSSESFYGSWGANKSTTGSSKKVQTLSTGSATHGSTRHEYFSCRIPPLYNNNASFIISYSVTEN